MQKVLIIGLGGQGKKYINYFLKNNYEVFGICKTDTTKQKIEDKYSIKVELDYKELDYNNFNIIIISLPPEIQGEISIYILEAGFYNKMIIEIPVTWNNTQLEKLKTYNNVFFFLEEYYTLLSKFLIKADISNIKQVDISIETNSEDYINELARKVSYIHVNNNFLGTNIESEILNYTFEFHDSENIYYRIFFDYNGLNIEYIFNKEKYLKIGDKKYIDEYNFDNVLGSIIIEEKNFNNYYYI